MECPNEENSNSSIEENAVPPPKHRQQNDLLEFIPELGDLSPISEFKGPRTPSRRQVLRLFLSFLALGFTLLEAGGEVVDRVLKKHPTASQTKTRKTLSGDVIALYKDTRFHV